ncbi:MAG TPA: hypothetical protein VFA37_02325 [Gaiellaceae bacterium]|nr:hypothetical protein [Gaiellaceae bacterium]
MTTAVRRPSLSLDPLIAEAKQRMRRRRLLVAAAVALLAAGTVAGVDAPRSATNTSPSGLAVFAGNWFGHTRGLDISRSGVGRESLSVGATPVARLTFKVLRVDGTRAAADARIRLSSVRIVDAGAFGRRSVPQVGELGFLRLRGGVVTDFITGASFCAPKPAAQGVCGL